MLPMAADRWEWKEHFRSGMSMSSRWKNLIAYLEVAMQQWSAQSVHSGYSLK